MARKLINTKEISHEEWLELRKRSIGGSEAGALVNMNPYASPLTLYLDKKNLSKPRETNESMRLGNDLEEYVAQRFCEETGKKVRRDNYMWQHDEYDYITANVDRVIVGENAGLECKTMGSFNNYDLENGEVPAYYWAQCQHYMMVMGYERMYLAILVFQKGIYINPIERNQEFIDGLLLTEKYFWENYIEKDQMPAPDGSEASTEAIKTMYPDSIKGQTIEMPNVDGLIKEYLYLSERINEIKEKQSEVKNKICSMLGTAEAGEGLEYKCSWKSSTTKRVDTEKLKKAFPEVYAAVVKSTTSRTFRARKR